MAAHFEVLTSDLEDLAYSPDGAAICCWDGPLEAQVLVYAPDGQLLARRADIPRARPAPTPEPLRAGGL